MLENQTTAAEPATGRAQQGQDLTNKSIVKATVILRKLGLFPQGTTVSELAAEVRMSRPTVFRVLLSLEKTGFVDRIENRYVLGWELARLGKLADPYAGLASRVQPLLDALTVRLQESSTFSVATGPLDFELVAESVGSRMLTTQQYVGQKYPLHASATGKIILAELSDSDVERLLPERLDSFTPNTIVARTDLIAQLRTIREQGYSILDAELEEELFAIACPVRDDQDVLIGVVNVNGPRQRFLVRSLTDTVASMIDTAHQITTVLS